MSSDYIEELIRQGENTSIEFKRGDVRTENLAKELIAFSNSSGGVVLLGIEDNGGVQGLGDDRNYEQWVSNLSRNNVIPPISVDYTESVLEGKKIGIIQVPKGKDRPYQDSSGRFYVRVGSTNRIASLNELMRLFQQSGFYHFDLTQIEQAHFGQLNQTALDKYFQSYDVSITEMDLDEKIHLLQNTDILSEESKTTVAGLLVFGINPQRNLQNALISFAHYRGNQVTDELIDKKNIEGSLPNQVETALQVIKNNLLSPSTIVGSKRTETQHYPDKIFRELIVNACVHRNYSITGSRIRILMFEDRIEVISPGKLPNTVTVEKLRAGVSYAVNPVIVKFMENLRYIDKLGRGLPLVCQAAQKLGKEVLFEEIGEEFKVTLFWDF